MAMRPLDRLPSIRAKLGSVIVFAVAVTILIMYIAVGFSLRKFERDQQFNTVLGEAQGVATIGFNEVNRPSKALIRAVYRLDETSVVVDSTGRTLVTKNMEVPPTVERALSGKVDSGAMGNREYIGIPITKQGIVVGAIYLSYRVPGGGFLGASKGPSLFVRKVWWPFLLAGASAAIIALLLARFLARGMAQPLRDMAQAASRMARGDYRQRVEVNSRDEVRRLAEAFNRMAGEMEGLERLRRDLVANVSHELKTPISALRAHLENLLDGVEKPDRATIEVMLRQSERLSRLVEQLLDLSRLDAGDVPLERSEVELSPLVGRVLSELSVAGAGRVHVATVIPA